jgi:hypothetical protein
MELAELIKHPEYFDRDTLYELRSTLALYPYYQTARLLMLENLYLLHDPTFDEELRRAAIYITDRKVLFNLIESAHYKLKSPNPSHAAQSSQEKENRTLSLIDSFLDTLPKDKDEEKSQEKPKRKPTPADAAVDYVAYLLENSEEEPAQEETPQMKGQELIDSFINIDNHKITLSDDPQLKPEQEMVDENTGDDVEEGVYTETLARIYIKQGRYSKALEIIRRLSLDYPKKNAYFADQIRFIEKLIINNNKNKR